MEEVLIDVAPGGKTRISTSGFKGKSCEEATRSLVEALGGDVVSDDPTPEMYEVEQEHQKAR